jgi:hypothetical protein
MGPCSRWPAGSDEVRALRDRPARSGSSSQQLRVTLEVGTGLTSALAIEHDEQVAVLLLMRPTIGFVASPNHSLFIRLVGTPAEDAPSFGRNAAADRVAASEELGAECFKGACAHSAAQGRVVTTSALKLIADQID